MAKVGEVNGGEGYTQDGTTDLKGNPVLRSNIGRWKATSFIVGYEAFERMAYYGISTNLVLYLTRKLHEGTVTSSNNVTNWVGTIWITPILGAYIADAHLGHYWTFIISSGIYLAREDGTEEQGKQDTTTKGGTDHTYTKTAEQYDVTVKGTEGEVAENGSSDKGGEIKP